jgi:hypothetical protein
MEKTQSGGLRTPAGLVPPSGLLRVWGGRIPVAYALMALTLVKFRETRSDWHDICATNLELLNSA